MPRNKQKWLTDKLKGDWLDKDEIIEIVLLESLRHFVEVEKGLNDPREAGLDQYVCDEQMYDDLSSAYEYIVTKYDNIEEEYDQDFNSVGELSEMMGRQVAERDAAIEKIWRHHKKMWV